MMAAAREEAAIITSEVTMAARTAVIQGGVGAERNAVMECMNPVAVRQAAEASVKSAAEDCSLLTHHLAHAPPPTSLQSTTTTTLTSLTNTASSSTASTMSSSTRTIVSRTLEDDLGTTLKEVMSNAMQTGVEEQMDEVADLAKNLVQAGGKANGPVLLTEVRESVQAVA
ncbi:hypothetical protein I316_03112 [Kwoniella heveanensis BCC8398]|uniref:Uncharacterized protein n=1 Tax=Kwoniella heveanensis BCC8398 TaxID=1296120 RepID=A0A1B9GVM3_9TREE|nr:hypothetical protein I316_03112 [Kwoniella heveanensis BCC8398]